MPWMPRLYASWHIEMRQASRSTLSSACSSGSPRTGRSTRPSSSGQRWRRSSLQRRVSFTCFALALDVDTKPEADPPGWGAGRRRGMERVRLHDVLRLRFQLDRMGDGRRVGRPHRRSGEYIRSGRHVAAYIPTHRDARPRDRLLCYRGQERKPGWRLGVVMNAQHCGAAKWASRVPNGP